MTFQRKSVPVWAEQYHDNNESILKIITLAAKLPEDTNDTVIYRSYDRSLAIEFSGERCPLAEGDWVVLCEEQLHIYPDEECHKYHQEVKQSTASQFSQWVNSPGQPQEGEGYIAFTKVKFKGDGKIELSEPEYPVKRTFARIYKAMDGGMRRISDKEYDSYDESDKAFSGYKSGQYIETVEIIRHPQGAKS